VKKKSGNANSIGMNILSYPATGYHYLIYLTSKTFKGEGLGTLNMICFLYILEMSAPFAYLWKSGMPLYIGCVLSAALCFYNDHVFNSEKIDVIQSKFDDLKMRYWIIFLQFVLFLFIPFIVFFSVVNI
jgi:hypothetical protein